jgi:arabinan endo-1,5-alpha-L-arabinosidase
MATMSPLHARLVSLALCLASGISTGCSRQAQTQSLGTGGASVGGQVGLGGSAGRSDTSTGGATGDGGGAGVGPGSGGTDGTAPRGGAEHSGGTTARDAEGDLSSTLDAAPSDTGGAIDSDDGDRCDLGIYDPSAPPKVLSLDGALATHDPSAIAAGGTYYLFYTGLGAETSANLTTWKAAARPFATPAWMTAAIPGVADLWAPDISEFGGKLHLYYAGSTFGAKTSCIGHATRNAFATGSWSDDGAATICSNVSTSDDWNAIDPNLIVDVDGKPWLALGSFWSGIKIIPLDSGGKRVGTTVTAIAARPKNGGALEAPFMVRRCGYYYLFTSWDTCCKGADSTYNIRVVRGTNVTGPFADKAGTAALQGGGTLIAEGNASFAGPGGQSVMIVGSRAYLVYHAYAKPSGATTLRIAELVWDSSGWPVPVGP